MKQGVVSRGWVFEASTAWFGLNTGLLLLPLLLPVSVESLRVVEMGSVSLDLQVLIISAVALMQARFLVTSRAGRGLLFLFSVPLVWAAIGCTLRLFVDPMLWPWMTWAFVELVVPGVATLGLMLRVTTSPTASRDINVLATALATVGIAVFAQQLVYGVIEPRDNPFVGEVIGTIGRTRTTVGAPTATGHTLYIMLVLVDLLRSMLGKTGVGIAHVALATAAILSASRAAVLMVVLYEASRFLFSPRRRSIGKFLAAAVPIVVLAFTGVGERFAVGAGQSDAKRILYVQQSLTAFAASQRIFLGEGFGTIGARCGIAPPEVHTGVPVSPHNSFVLVLLEQGLVGLVLGAIILMVPIVHLWSTRRNPSGKQGAFRSAVYGYLVYIIIGGSTETLLFNEMQSAVPLILMYALLYVAPILARRGAGTEA